MGLLFLYNLLFVLRGVWGELVVQYQRVRVEARSATVSLV